MKLSVWERLILGNILPPEGNFATLKVLRNLRMTLSFSEEETKKWAIGSPDLFKGEEVEYLIDQAKNLGSFRNNPDHLKKLKEALSVKDGQVNWRLLDNEDKPIDQEAEIELGEKAKDIIVLSLAKLNEEKKLRNEHYTLYERFIGDK